MARPQSNCPDPRRAAAAVLVSVGLTLPAGAAAQSSLDAACHTAPGADPAECLLAVATVRAAQERLGIALWGGNPVPGTASTVGMRIGTAPRISAAARLAVVPASLPPLTDRDQRSGERLILTALSGHATVGVFQGWSPLPTVGGVLSLDAVGRLSLAMLPGEFNESVAMGWAAGVRLGALRESFTMPGVSLTTTYGRSSHVTYGDAAGAATDGFARGSVSDLNATLAVSRRIAPVRLTGGLALDRYASRARIGYPDAGGGLATERGMVTTHRQSLFAGGEWTVLIFHTSAEVGWQRTDRPDGLPADVLFHPSSWWGSVAFRLSI